MESTSMSSLDSAHTMLYHSKPPYLFSSYFLGGEVIFVPDMGLGT